MMGELVDGVLLPQQVSLVMKTNEKLKLIISSPRLQEKSKLFVESLLSQSEKKDLSEKQLSFVEKFWNQCFPPQDLLDEEKEWTSSFTEEMRENSLVIARYHSIHYRSSRLSKMVDDPSYIPTKEIYENSVNSAWAKRVIKNFKSDYIFNVGDFCTLRDTQLNRCTVHRDYIGIPLLVLDADKSAQKEFSNQYKLIDPNRMEEQDIFVMPEKNLIAHKVKKG
jgi:hypothetical protein